MNATVWLTVAGLIVTGGRLADTFGRRRMFFVGSAIFAVFSIIAGGMPSISISKPSAVKRSTQRLAKKPRESLTTMGVLPMTRT